jgi:hypothetical protein
MTLTLKARYRDGKFEPTEPVQIAHDSEVILEVHLTDEGQRPQPAPREPALPADDPLARVIGILDGPPDLATNHDHYLYRLPKRNP